MGGGGVQFAGVGVGPAAHVTGILHHRHLHAQADAQEGDPALPGPAHGGDLPLNAPAAEASRDQDAVRPVQQFRRVPVGDGLRVHPADVHLYVVLDAPVGQGLRHRQIGVVEGHIFANQGDLHTALWMLGTVDHGGPLRQVGHVADQPQPADHHVGQPLPFQHQGDLVQHRGGEVGDGILHRDVAEQGDLLQNIPGHRRVAAADDDIGLDAQGEQLFGGVLGGLALQLPGAGDGYDEGDMEKHDVVASPLGGYLADGLQEGLGLDIAHGAADLHDGHVSVRGVQRVNVPLDLIGDVGDDLDRGSQIVPGPLPVEHVPVDLPRGDGGVDGEVFVDKALIVAQVQVGLGPIVGDEDLPVLVGAHGARVHVQVRVQLLDLYPQAPLLQQAAQRGRRDALAQAGNHAAGDKNVLHCHVDPSIKV